MSPIEQAIQLSIYEDRTVDVCATENELDELDASLGVIDWVEVDGYLDAWGTTEADSEWRLKVCAHSNESDGE